MLILGKTSGTNIFCIQLQYCWLSAASNNESSLLLDRVSLPNKALRDVEPIPQYRRFTSPRSRFHLRRAGTPVVFLRTTHDCFLSGVNHCDAFFNLWKLIGLAVENEKTLQPGMIWVDGVELYRQDNRTRGTATASALASRFSVLLFLLFVFFVGPYCVWSCCFCCDLLWNSRWKLAGGFFVS